MFRNSFQASSPFSPMFLILFVLITVPAWSSSFNVIYDFGFDGHYPSSGLILDAQGNAYGTTLNGGNGNGGTVYEISRTTGYHVLHIFGQTNQDGRDPQGNLILDSAGNLYGTTISGGGCNGSYCGTEFKLSPPSSGEGPWIETLLYTFCSAFECADGAFPNAGVTMDSAGNLYGTTLYGGVSGGGGLGTVFELQPTPSGPWAETVLYTFMGDGDGGRPMGNVILDQAGSLYGTSYLENGSVFQLSPSPSGWALNVIYTFGSSGGKDGHGPESGLVFDLAGNLYGTTTIGGQAGKGIIFELTPNAGTWTETILHNFADKYDGSQPRASLVIDSSGNLYGTTFYGGGKATCGFGASCGTVFKLTHGQGGQWAESLFRLPLSGDGGYWPSASLLLSGGSIYGTTTRGGVYKQYKQAGALFEIAP